MYSYNSLGLDYMYMYRYLHVIALAIRLPLQLYLLIEFMLIKAHYSKTVNCLNFWSSLYLHVYPKYRMPNPPPWARTH